MILGGTLVKQGTNNLCKFTTEWYFEPYGGYPDRALRFIFKIYFEASGAERISKASEGHGTITFDNHPYYFSTSEISSTEKQLIATVTTGSVSLARLQECTTACVIKFGVPEIKLYTGFISYVKTTGDESISIFPSAFTSTVIRSTDVTFPSDCVLGSDALITVTKPYDEYSHTITWACGTDSGTLCEYSNETAITTNFPIELSAQNPTGSYVDITFTVTTHYEDANIYTKTYTGSYYIPDSVVPSCTMQVSDGSYLNDQTITSIYGGYVQLQSTYHIVVNAVPAYGCPIVSYKITADGSEYDTEEVTTAVITGSGEQTITVIVTDERGRTSELVTETVNVIPYSLPVVSRVKINRCDKDGIEQATGNDHIKVTFDAEISPVNDKNSASYMLRYQKTSGLDQADIYLINFDGQYSVTDGIYVFEADVMSPYNITIFAVDDFAEGKRTTGGSTATTLINFLASGLGLNFGAIATIEGAIENTFLTYPSGGFMFPKLLSDDSLYDIETPNVYTCDNGNNITGSPTSNPFTLVVLPGGTGEILYIVIDIELNIYIRRLKNSSFSVWKTFALTDV